MSAAQGGLCERHKASHQRGISPTRALMLNLTRNIARCAFRGHGFTVLPTGRCSKRLGGGGAGVNRLEVIFEDAERLRERQRHPVHEESVADVVLVPRLHLQIQPNQRHPLRAAFKP